MRKILHSIILFFTCLPLIHAELPWSQRMANSVILTNPGYYNNASKGWYYVNGTMLSGLQELYKQTNNSTYLDYIEATVQNNLSNIVTSTKTLDNIKEGTAVLFMYENTSNSTYKASYQTTANELRALLVDGTGIGRTTEGGLWHKDPGYAWQMWGDGLYMAQPFYAQYSTIFNNSASEDFDDIANQFIVFESHARDTSTGLLYHGWSEQPTDYRSTAWANPTTGLSSCFWARANGWYIMGLIDVLDYFPTSHNKYQELISILNRLVPALIYYQDNTTGCWYDILDQGTRCSSAVPAQCNYIESSASCMITYSMLKAIRKGYISDSYLPAAKKAYEGILSNLVVTSGDTVIITNDCQVGGLGGNANRDGSFDYYMSEPIVTSEVDGKPIGPFILASLEYEDITTKLSSTKKSESKFTAYSLPNKTLNLQFNLNQDSSVKINLLDITGKKVLTIANENLKKGFYNENIQLSNLNKGIYLLEASDDNSSYYQKIAIR